MFAYSPESGLFINGPSGSALMGSLDHINLDDGMGYISVATFFNDKKITLTQKEFLEKHRTESMKVRNKVDKLLAYAYALGKRNEDFKIRPDDILKKLKDEKGFYSREALIMNYMDIVAEAILDEPDSDKLDKIEQLFMNSGILDFDLDTKGRSPGVVTLFYSFANTFCTKRNLDYSTTPNTALALSKFPFYDELMQEYKRQPDGRFGDILLVMLSEQDRHQQKLIEEPLKAA